MWARSGVLPPYHLELNSEFLDSPTPGHLPSPAPQAPLVGAGSYALLRPGVPPHDPHLIAPVVPGTCGSPVCTAWGGTSDAGGVAGGLIAAARPLSSLRSPAVAQHSRGWRQELAGLGEQLRAATAGWQGLAAAVASVQGSSAAQAGQLAGLSSRVADLQAAQGRLEQAAAEQRLEVQGRLAELGGRLDALAAGPLPPAGGWGPGQEAGSGGSAAAATAAEGEALQAVLAARLARLEAELAGLQAGMQQEGGDAAGASAGQPSGELAAMQAQLAALKSAQGSAERRQEEAAAQAALLGGQLAELGAEQRDSWRQLGTRVEQLAQLLAEMGAGQPEGQRQRQQDAGAGSCSTQQETTGPAASLECIEQLAGKVDAGAEALGGLQAQVGAGGGCRDIVTIDVCLPSVQEPLPGPAYPPCRLPSWRGCLLRWKTPTSACLSCEWRCRTRGRTVPLRLHPSSARSATGRDPCQGIGLAGKT